MPFTISPLPRIRSGWATSSPSASSSPLPPCSKPTPTINRNFVPLHRRFLAVLPQDAKGSAVPQLTSFEGFTLQVLEWDPADLATPELVEACRQLGNALVAAWHPHDQLPPLPLDEDELLHARRLVAQRCLYGVDRNPIAADLAKLSLWLATLARSRVHLPRPTHAPLCHQL